ncbi:MAG: metallophosphoesterase [Deltaproteobacteria bacterium]|nr:metallophosphoesterase [Deltaproteobacteria bacterium]
MAGGIAALGAAGPVWWTQNRSPRFRMSRSKIPWPQTHRTLRIAHLTDLHVGLSTPLRDLESAIECVRQEAPDLVVLTGDYVNYGLQHLETLQALLRRLPRPALATLGNHDHWSGAQAIQEALESAGIEVLVNTTRRIHLENQARIEVIGIDDGRTDHDDVKRACDAARQPDEALVLSHFPPLADRIAELGGRIILSGHTHGGQVHLPGITPWVAERSGHAYLSGWYDVGDEARLYVNAGLGHSRAGLRIGAPAYPEIAFLELEPCPMESGRSEV